MKRMTAFIMALVTAFAMTLPAAATPEEWSSFAYHTNQGWLQCPSGKHVGLRVGGYGEYYQLRYTDPFFIARTRTSGDAGAKAWREWSYYTGNNKVKLARGRVGFDTIHIPDDPIASYVIHFCY